MLKGINARPPQIVTSMSQPAETPQELSVLDSLTALEELLGHIHASVPAKKVFIEGQERALRYGDALEQAALLAAYLGEQGVAPGARMVVITSDDLALATFFLAGLYAGITVVPLHDEGSPDELDALMAAAKPAAVLVDQDLRSRLDIPATAHVIPVQPGAAYRGGGLLGGLLGGKKPVDADCWPGLTRDKDPVDFAPCAEDPESTAYILFTSGTTSRPKGVEIPRRALLAQEKTFVRHYGLSADSRILNILPLHHTDGLTHGVFMAFCAGATVYRPMTFRVDRLPALMDAMYKHRITLFMAVPAMLQLIDSLGGEFAEAFHAPEMSFVVSTAGYLDPALWQRFEDHFGVRVVNVYGLTETVCETIYCGPDDATRKMGTIGKPVDSQAKIVDDEGNETGDGAEGELWVKGDHIMTGYFEMPEESAAVLTDDGWLKTGDLAVRDADGFYSIIGRKKNVIITGGMNIYPEDVANVLRTLPGVLDAVVYGEKDDTWGEVAIAAVEAEPGAELDGAELVEDMREKTSPENLPARIIVLDKITRGPAGKPVLAEVRKAVAALDEAAADEIAEQAGGDALSGVVATAARTFKVDAHELSLESTPDNTKGWNSLAHVEFILALEKHFGIKMEPREIMAIHSLADAHDAVLRHTGTS